MIALLASCAEKEFADSTVIPAGGSDAVVPARIVATFGETKVTYEEKYNRFRPLWEIGDEIIALGEGGANYTLTVETVNPDNSATLIGEVPETCSLHLIYCPGISATNLTVDYTAQAGTQDTMPAVMLSDGKVNKGGGRFTFRNAGAIIGISAVKGVPSGAAISKITVEGENLSAATVALDGTTLKLTATTAASDAISTATLTGITTTDANGTLSSPVFIAVPAGAVIAKVSASVAVREPETMTIPSLAADRKNLDYVEIAAKYDGTNVTTKKWAKWNVGANSQTDYGWYFFWGGTEGYVYKNSKWVSVSGVDTYYYTLSSVKTANASDYLYVKTQSFTPGFGFDHAHIPYHTGSDEHTGWTKYIPTAESSYWSGAGAPDNKTVLDPEDDAATVNWHGTWRMPTLAEFQALYSATKWTWDSTDNGYYLTEKGVTLSGDKSNALLFFPAAGIGLDANFFFAGSYGYYWSSSLNSSNPQYAYYLNFLNGNVNSHDTNYRCLGRSVRPISD